MDSVIYIGIGINIVGALLLMAYAFKYHNAFKESERLTPRMDELKQQWGKKRVLGFGLMIGGAIVAIIGCFL